MKNSFLLLTSEADSNVAGDSRSAIAFHNQLNTCNHESLLISFSSFNIKSCNYHKDAKCYILKYGEGITFKIISRLLLSVLLVFKGSKYRHWIIYGKTRGNRIAIIIGAILGRKVIFRSTLWGFDNISTLVKSHPLNRFNYSLSWGYWGLNNKLIEDYKSTINKNRVFLSAQGVPNIFFSTPSSDKDALRSKLGLPKSVPILISVGHIIHRKGLPEIFQWLSEVENDFIYVLVGENSPSKTSRLYRKRMEMEHIKLQGNALLGNRIRFEGPQINVAEYLYSSDIFVHGAYAEGFPPNSLNEAMACGLPCLVRRIEGIDKELEESSCIRLFSDKKQFTKGIEELIDSADLRNKLGSNARGYAEQHLRIENVATKLLKFVSPHSS